MTLWTLARRGLTYHWRAHLGVLLGAAAASTVLIGALAVGDSVQESLRELALARLGRVDLALESGDRLFREALAAELAETLRASAAPVLQVAGVASAADGAARANHVNIFGVDDRFWALAPDPGNPFGTGGCVLNERLAGQLGAKPGDEVLLRFRRPSALSGDAPLSNVEDDAVALRIKVEGVVPAKLFGQFSLLASQVPPYNVFLPLRTLQENLRAAGRANLLLLALPSADGSARAAQGLRQRFTLADAELELRELPAQGVLELRSSRIFLEPRTVEAVLAAAPEARPALTYFVNALRVGERSTPYSMVTAAGPPVVPAGTPDSEMLVGTWLAEDLGATGGEALEMDYYVMGPLRKLEERTKVFRVGRILPLAGPAADREWMPPFPGLAQAENCRDWKPGFALDLKRIRDKDEEYWKQQRGTPKAFITLKAGQELWRNRFGALTCIRFPYPETKRGELEGRLLRALDPAAAGLSFAPVRERALRAVEQGVDFGQLFLGFSFFLIAAALLLTGLLFGLAVEGRAQESGVLLALGFAPRLVRRLALLEGLALSVLGGLLGLCAGGAYARGMLHGLSTAWRGAVGTGALTYHGLRFGSAAAGLGGGVLMALVTVAWITRRQARRPARELLAAASLPKPCEIPGRSRGIWVAALAGCAAVGLAGLAGAKREWAVGAFFGSGGLFLLAGLGACAASLAALGRAHTRAGLSLPGLALRNAARRRGRSLATVALLACGCFLVAAVGANRQDPLEGAARRGSGTGGFALYGETSLPLVHDLNARDGRQAFGVSEEELAGVSVVPLRVGRGEDASCLNLNRAQVPRLLGVNAEELARRGAFTFTATALEGGSPWRLLDQPQADGAVPVVADANTLEWGLGLGVGDTLEYQDELGRAFRVRVVGALASSILQGNLIAAERDFLEHFPSATGYRILLLDAPPEHTERVAHILGRALSDLGLETRPAWKRLAEFNAVEETYLTTFQALGGLGLLLGSLGLGIVVLRNVLERRAELALLRAVGFSRRALLRLVLGEHAGLLAAGWLCGLLAAGVAVFPALRSPGAQVPYASLGLLLGGVLLNGLCWTWLAAAVSLRGPLLAALRESES